MTEQKQEEKIPDDILKEAEELSRNAEILPEGENVLAKRIWAARKAGRKLRVKLGVDPTSTDLHIGHAVQFRMLKRFQDYGHQVVLIIGGFTAQIGDPSGRSVERTTQTSEEVARNAETYLSQIELILDLNKTELRNNADWLATMNLSDTLKLASKATIAQLLAKEGFKERFGLGHPISLHEMFYPLLQGYDSVIVESDIEFGGTDQRFNILQGRDLQAHYGQETQLAYLLPLLEGTDGTQKMSKTTGNYIALKDKPDDMYGKTMSIPDALIVKYFELATSFSAQEVDEISKQFEDTNFNNNILKRKLAEQIVRQYHGEEAAKQATETWDRVHSKHELPDDIRSHKLAEPTALFKILVETGLSESGGKAKKDITGGGIYIDGERITDPNILIEINSGESKVVQKGRRQFVRLEA